MLKNIIEMNLLYYLMVVAVGVGVTSKLVLSYGLSKLSKEACAMGTSTNPFLKLVRSKFEHSCMVNQGVDNVEVFVDKYLRECKIGGLSLRGLQRIEKVSLLVVAASGLMGAGMTYSEMGGGELVNQYLIISSVSALLLLAAYQMVDEQYRYMTLRIYMVDYLDNVLASKMEKQRKSEETRKQMELESNEEMIVNNSYDELFASTTSGVSLETANEIIENQVKQIQENKIIHTHEEIEDLQVTKEFPGIRIKQDTIELPSEKELIETLKKQKENAERKVNESIIREILQEFMA